MPYEGGTIIELRHPLGFSVRLSEDGDVIESMSDVTADDVVATFVEEQVVPRVRSHQGNFVLHAGVVAGASPAFIVSGPPGQGKSTLVASFCEEGYPLLGDDACEIDVSPAGVTARSLAPSLRLFADSAALLSRPHVHQSRQAANPLKKRIAFRDALEDHSRHVSAAFILCKSDNQLGLSKLTKREGAMALLRNSFALDPVDKRRAAIRLEQAAAIAEAIPVYDLVVPHDYKRLREVRDTITTELQRLQDARI